MLSLAHNCAAQALASRDPNSRRPLVILARSEEIPGIQAIVAVTLPLGSKCSGSSWEEPNGRIVAVKRFSEPPLGFPGGFDLFICSTDLSTEAKDVQRWRDAAGSVDP